MSTFVRWTAFALAIAAAAVAGSLMLLMLSRLYGALQSSTFLFTVLAFFSVTVTLAAIGYASKLEDEDEAADEPKWQEDDPDDPLDPEPDPRPGP